MPSYVASTVGSTVISGGYWAILLAGFARLNPMSLIEFAVLDKTTAPDRNRVENPAKEAYPPVMPSFQTISSSFPDRTNQPRPAFEFEFFVGRRVCSNRSIAGRSGAPASATQVAFMNLRRSLAVDRSAPAPATVGKSQSGVALRLERWPCAR